MTFGEEVGDASVLDSMAAPHMEYNEQTESYRAEFDHQKLPATEAVVTAVATVTDTDPLELPPLGSVLDPDALNGVFDSARDEGDHSETAITFEYAAHIVTVNSHGTVLVKPVEDSQS